MIELRTRVLALLVGSAAAAAPSPPPAFPDSVAGRRARAYFEAFNSGSEEAMRAFFEENVAASSLAARPMEARLSMYRQMKGDVGTLEPVKVLREEAGAIGVLARTQGGWLRVELRLEADAPHGILAIALEESDGPDEEAVEPLRDDAELAAALGAWLSELAARDEMSGVVLVAKGGKTLFEQAHGMASREHRVKNRTDTRFCLGSISKLFTKIAILQLADRGKLSLDDPLGKHLPDYPNADAARKVTVRHLLDMSSGIGDFFGPTYDATPKDRIRTLQDYLPMFAKEPLLFEPGSDRRYSNGGYLVLGLIIEKLAGRSYHDHVRDALFVPAGMTASGWFESDAVEPDVAMGYTREGCPPDAAGCRRTNVFSRPGRGSSAGGSYATAQDLLRLVVALEQGKLLSPERTRELLAGGLGVAGGAPGMNAILDAGGPGGTTVVVLCNEDPPQAEKIGRRIRAWLPRASP